ncbi:AlwI restriction endonuclease [Aeribacillus composti]|uniref:AlwI family type II restriction endonuclease n=1 Tax=Aeribacillus TaxID=1055323 RepID=UPI00119AE70C|nr:AlwI family type II restriction endonuclease [Aeribacillus composti]TVZ76549.1 AlwI restriction endonuclease [Aeribacillus composti]BBU41395.1 hypothetical protein APP_36870 [Aeribacillus pallidus]
MAKKVNWYVSCSPRSPEKIQPELKVLANFEGSYWKGVKGYKAQEAFAKELAALPQFLGTTYKKEAAFSTRDRVAPMKTYGFVFVDEEGYLRITEAGKMLANNRRPKDVFLKQLVKWQYPSFQHKGKEYPEEEWSINPLVFVLSLLKKVGGLSKLDIAMFCLTATNNNQVDEIAEEIMQFRNEREKIKGQNKKLEFTENYFFKRFEKIYGNVGKIREGKSDSSHKSKIETKMRNARDVADATTRYFRYTGLFVARGNQLVLNPEKSDLIDEIISSSKVVKNYTRVEEFHEYYGNPSLPQFSFETKEQLLDLAHRIRDENTRLAEQLVEHFPNVKVEIQVLEDIYNSLNKKVDVETLKDVIYHAKELQLELKKKKLQADFNDPRQLEEVIDLLEVYHEKKNVIEEKIKARFIANKNTVFEWLTWNGFIILGNALEYKNNFVIDEELQPVTHAAGNQPDMEIIYEDFIVLGEVTTSKGATQFKMESEPVTRHYLNMKKELEKQGVEKELYCLFIAPEINKNTFEEFMKYNIVQNTRIIPLSLKQFNMLLMVQKKLIEKGRRLSSYDIKNLMVSLYRTTIECERKYTQIKAGLEETLNNWVVDKEVRF